MKNNKYNEEFSNYVSIMNEALQKGDFKAYEIVKSMLDEAIDDCKNEKSLMNEMNTSNFGILNHIFEEALPTLFKENKKAVKNVINTIKKDKNLMCEFHFYNLIRQYDGKIGEYVTPEKMIEKINEITKNKINVKTVIESNKKLRKVMKENNIIPMSHLTEKEKKLYESGHNILTKKSNFSNMVTLAESFKVITDKLNENKSIIKENKDNVIDKINEFENSLKSNLTESEISFVQQITDFRSPIAEQRKEKLFNKFKNECIDKINEMLKEDSTNQELVALKEQLEEQKFNKDSIVKDIAKMLEIRDILMDD